MINFQQFKRHWGRLKTTEEDDIFDVLGAVLSQSTKDAILADINDAVEAAINQWQTEIEDVIRDEASKLDSDDPLRLAIEGTS